MKSPKKRIPGKGISKSKPAPKKSTRHKVNTLPHSTDKIANENEQLREALKRRTLEVEQKNRELEIESSLKRVRSIAMKMRRREDMLFICKTI